MKIKIRINSLIRRCFLLSAIAGATLAANASDRIALVVGSDAYTHAQPLKNAVSDARLVSKVFQETGFEVIALENPGIDAFYEGLDQLKRKAGIARVGIVYFAGHGVEVEGKNYLLPVDAELKSSVQLRSQAISLETILEDLADARLPAKVVILDCCRDNPLKRSWMTTRSIGRGLAPVLDVDMPDASLVVYSAGPGQVALDGKDGNSPFTKALASRLKQPGQNLLQAFLKTSDDVVDVTGGRQEPWVKMDAAGRTMRELVLVPAAASSAVVAKKEFKRPAPETASNTQPEPPKVAGNNPPGAADTPAVGNGTGAGTAAVALAANEGAAMKETPAPANGESAPTIGNTPEEPEEKAKPLVLPERGYFSNSEVFDGGPYSGYNTYSKGKILRSAQGKLDGAGSPDGKMGRNTQAAIQSYQDSKNLPVTGLLDTPTLTALGMTGLKEETYVAPKKTYTKPKTYTSNSSSNRSAGSSSNNSGSSSNRSSQPSQQSSQKRTMPSPFPMGHPPKVPGYQPPKKGGSRMSHARKKYMRPG